MKTVKFLSGLLVAAALTVSSVYANDAKVASDKTTELSVSKQIKSIVSKISTSETGTVAVYFTVTEKGLTISGINGQNNILVREVKRALTSKNIEVAKALEGMYKVTVRFTDNNDLSYTAYEESTSSESDNI